MIAPAFRIPAALVAAVSSLCLASGIAAADDKIKLPSTVTWTSYGAGGSVYNQAVALGTVMKRKLGVTLRVIPAQNDIARQRPLKQGRIAISQTGAGAYYAQEGVLDFAKPDWGPQPVRLLMLGVSRAHAALVVAGDVGVKKMSDLKGKRVAYVVGAPSLNELVRANLAFAGLTWKDVKRVEVSGFRGAITGLMEGRLDAAILASTTAFARRVAASSRGGYYPPLPASDTAGWARLKKVVPYLVPNKDPIGAMIPKGFEGVALPLPFLMTLEKADPDFIYNMTKAIFVLYPDYKDAAPGAGGYGLNRQIFDFVIPYHPGAIRYFKEAGVWTSEHDAHNAKMIERQKVLAAAWKEAKAAGGEGEAFQKKWMEIRNAALVKAGFDPIFK